MKNDRKWENLLICILFYLMFVLIDGYVLGADSNGYINMISAREPVYPLFLALFRKIFGTGIYLYAVAAAQAVLMGVAVWLLTGEIALMGCPAWLFMLPHFGVALLTRFASDRGCVYSNMIMTEGVSYSLWLILIFLIIRWIRDGRYRYLVYSLLLLTLMLCLRKQLAAGYIVFVMATVVGRAGKEERTALKERVLISVAACAFSVVTSMMISSVYNDLLHGSFEKNTRDMNLILTTSLYVADKTDALFIEEEGVRRLFTDTMTALDKKKANIRYAGRSLSELEEHYEEMFDVITVDTTGPLFIERAMERGFAEGMSAEHEADRMSGVIVKAVFFDNVFKYAKVFMASFLNGIVNTVAARGTALAVYTGIVFVLFIELAIVCIRNKKRDASDLAAVALIAIVVNTGVCAALIFTQSRYMIYNMALFYDALIFLAAEFLGIIELKKRVKNLFDKGGSKGAEPEAVPEAADEDIAVTEEA